MTTTYYTIVTGEGGELTTGIQSREQAMQAAREYADELNQTVYVSGPGIDMDPEDDEDIGLAVRPTRRS